MMLVDNLILTVKDEDGVIINRHFNEVYVSIKSTEMTVSNRSKDIVTYKLTDVFIYANTSSSTSVQMFQMRYTLESFIEFIFCTCVLAIDVVYYIIFKRERK